MRTLVLSDTHAPRRWKALPDALVTPLNDADLVLHLGDVCTPDVLDTLASFAPVEVVLGNNDGPDVAAWGATPTRELTLGGVRVAMIHDAGPAAGRDRRMRRRFPDADLVIFGHSHIPLDDASGAVRLLNPGSPTDKRRQPHGTFAWLDVDAGQFRTRIVELGEGNGVEREGRRGD